MRHPRTPQNNTLYMSPQARRAQQKRDRHEPCYNVKEVAALLHVTPGAIHARLEARTFPQPDLVSGFTAKVLFWKRSTIHKLLQRSDAL